MVTGIRHVSKDVVVVYSNDRDVCSKLRKRKSCLKIIPYEQEQYSKHRVALIGYDFYFPKKELKGLLRPGTVKT